MSWTFFSNHGHVYFLLAKNGDLTIRELSIKVGITDRCVQNIINDLEFSEYIKKNKIGRVNHYKVNEKKYLRHDLESNVSLDDLVKIINK